MSSRFLFLSLLVSLFAVADATAQTSAKPDTSPHKVQFVTVDQNVKLEVLDWGGAGRPLVFLAGLGGTAHQFDTLAPKFTATNHVYAITRRGFGNSSKPDPATGDYSADRLGDDVLAVIDTLKLDHPVLAGHSLAGEELSSVGSRHPEKVSGLVYLDAGYAYAYYTPGNPAPVGANLVIDAKNLTKKLEQLKALPPRSPDLKLVIQGLLETDLPDFEKDLATAQAVPTQPDTSLAAPSLQIRIERTIINGVQKYTNIRVPVLAIFAPPNPLPADAPAAARAHQVSDIVAADDFAAGLPSARVVRLPGASHAPWKTNEADVMREMNTFMNGLPSP